MSPSLSIATMVCVLPPIASAACATDMNLGGRLARTSASSAPGNRRGNLGFAKYSGTNSTLGAEDRLAVRIGPGVRAVVAHSEDERAELFLHGDLALIVLNVPVPAGRDRTYQQLDEVRAMAGEVFMGQRDEEKLAGAALPTSR
jgi:hypothetical protein